MTEEFGRVTGYGGRVTSPIIDEDKVILTMVCSSWGELTVGMTRLVALDKKTGKIIWWGSGSYRVSDTYYATPVVAVINGIRTILSGGGDGCIHAFKVRTGEKLWSYKFDDGGGAVNCSPVVKGNMIWVGHGEENTGNSTQGRIICLDAGTMVKGEPKLVWKHDGVKVKFTAPILHDGLLYVCDDGGKLFCFDAEKGGEAFWEFEYGRATKGSPVWADGKIYISEVDSKFHILKPSRKGCERLHEQRFRSRTIAPVELHAAPAIVNGRVYFTTTQQLICIGKPDHKTPADKIPEPVKEAKGIGPATHLQVFPADVSLKPGESAELSACTYDAMGRRIGQVKVDWTRGAMLPPVYPVNLKPPPAPKMAPFPFVVGKLSNANGLSTTFTADLDTNGQFGRIEAKSGDLTAHARIRGTIKLLYDMDFRNVEIGHIPGGWVNAMQKFAVVQLPNGTKVLRKRNDNANPLVARANAYIGDPHMSDYTIECDVFGTKVRDKDMPDIGVGACRYSLVLIGNDQEVRLVTWDAQKRIEKKIPFNFQPSVWYRMKLMATVVDGKGIVKGKVWPGNAKEPEKWTLEVEDPVPNTEGAPLIYGFANGTIDAKNPGPEIHYANLKMYANKK
jgi:outer membrane protein assembly factor BamB